MSGYPTLKLLKPSASGGDPQVEDYRGPRDAPQMMAFVHSHVDAVGNNRLKKRKEERAKRTKKDRSGEQKKKKLPKCKDSAWFYSPKQHVYNLCRDFFPPASTINASLVDGGRGRDVYVFFFLSRRLLALRA